MSCACTPVLVGVVSLVSEILLPFKNSQISLSGNLVIEKFNQSESAQKIHASRGQCHMHVHQFWWAWSLQFQRYGYLSKTAKFPFRGMDYSPWSSKNLIDQNRLKKIMQVGIDIKCMHTSFGWVWSLQFQRYCYLSKTAKFPMVNKKFNQSESAQKNHASRGQYQVHAHQF